MRQSSSRNRHLSRNLDKVWAWSVHVLGGEAFQAEGTASAKVRQLEHACNIGGLESSLKGIMEEAGPHLLLLPPTLALRSPLGLCIHQESPEKQDQ